MDPAPLPGDQHLGARRPLGVGKIAVLFHDQRAAERNHHQDAHQPACNRQDRDAPNVEVVAHQQNRRDRKDDSRRHRIRRRAGRLDNVVFENRGAAKPAEDRNRQNGNWDRGADGEPDLERQVDVRRAENQPEQHAEHDGPGGQLGGGLGRRNVGLVRGGGGSHRPQNLRPKLRRCPAAIHELSLEPVSGPRVWWCLMPGPTEQTLTELRAALADVYDIEAPIGRGGMGHVYLARERRLDRRVAIKVLPPDLALDDTRRRRFLREARTVARLTHPSIVPIFTVDEIGGFVFFAMAYVAGETLSQRVMTRGPLDPHEASRLLREVGDALGYAHARGLVHRDVKPDNILLDTATDRALLSDFGIAYESPFWGSPFLGGPGLLRRPAAPRGLVIGTAAFMSPEQASGDAVDARSDIYSLGVVAYYALSGRLP